MTEQPMDVFADKLDRLARLSVDDKAAIRSMPCQLKTLLPGIPLVVERNTPQSCALLLDGLAIRSKYSSDGARQIVAIQLRGDALDLQHLYLEEADHSVEPVTPVLVAEVPRSAVRHVAEGHPNVMKAILIDNLIEASISREWLLNVGRRSARERVAHLICEVATRLSETAIADKHGFHLPMTQDQLGDATGLTPVHVNRMLRNLEAEGSISRMRHQFRIESWSRLTATADFDPAYLHRDQLRAIG
ncbi:MAG: Crp/Fnr family transcriptional regulator [Oxalobacteraceae bacterium]|nr:MAG: Crp/Fnr family transcriptional regulator [Oxalobacteraceae bacterium]